MRPNTPTPAEPPRGAARPSEWGCPVLPEWEPDSDLSLLQNKTMPMALPLPLALHWCRTEVLCLTLTCLVNKTNMTMTNDKWQMTFALALAVAPEVLYAQQLTKLREMGFDDNTTNIAARPIAPSLVILEGREGNPL